MEKPKLRVLDIAFFFSLFLGNLAENLRGKALFPIFILENKLFYIYSLKVIWGYSDRHNGEFSPN